MNLQQIVGEFSLGVQTFCVDYKDCFNLVSTKSIRVSKSRADLYRLSASKRRWQTL